MSKSIPWEGYVTAGLVSQEDLDLILKPTLELNQITAPGAAQDLERVFLKLLGALKKEETVEYLLIVLDELVQANPEMARAFRNAEAYGVLCKFLDRNDKISYLAANVVSHLACADAKMEPDLRTSFLRWITAQLQNSVGSVTSVRCLKEILRNTVFRNEFFLTPNSVSSLTSSLRLKEATYQQRYDAVFCFWLLSFNPEISSKLNDWNLIPLLIEIIKSSIKEKVVRVCLMTLHNMVETAGNVARLPLMDNKFLKLCETLAGRKWSDDDIPSEIEFLKEELLKNVQELSSFDEYAAEVRSGKLDWSPVHRSESFWKINASRLQEKDNELLKILVRVLNVAETPTVLAVAIHDIGEYVRHSPRGKKIAQDLGAKDRIMQLMAHEDPTVRLEALVAVQKYFVNNWEYLSHHVSAIALKQES